MELSWKGMKPGAVASALAALLWLGGCAGPAPKEVAPQGATAAPVHAQGIPYRIDGTASELRILVERAGPLARLGHNHVVRASGLQGQVWRAANIGQSSFELTVPVQGLVVDAASDRADEGGEYASVPSSEAIAGTRENMLGRELLDAARHPHIQIRSLGFTGPAWQPDARLRVTLRGVSRELTVPIVIVEVGERLVVGGQMTLRQSEFGITPFSVMGGGLRVDDRLRIRFRIEAVRAGAPE